VIDRCVVLLIFLGSDEGKSLRKRRVFRISANESKTPAGPRCRRGFSLLEALLASTPPRGDGPGGRDHGPCGEDLRPPERSRCKLCRVGLDDSAFELAVFSGLNDRFYSFPKEGRGFGGIFGVVVLCQTFSSRAPGEDRASRAVSGSSGCDAPRGCDRFRRRRALSPRTPKDRTSASDSSRVERRGRKRR